MDKIRLSRSVVGEREKEALASVISEGYLGMGSFVERFERELSEYIGAKYVMCVNSGTAALHAALEAADLRPLDEVLVQSLTFIASYQAITAAGATPVSCEVEPETCTIDLNDAAKKITRKTKAIMPVHYASRAGDLDGIYTFARERGLRVIEDAAHAFGTIYNGKKIGSFGDIACFSFDGIKNITSGEGGAVATNDEAVAERVMDSRLLGVHKDTEKRFRGERSWEFDVFRRGYRYHMSNLFAAVGSVQLSRLENEFKPARQKLARNYHEALKEINGIGLFPDDYSRIIPHIFPIKVLSGKRDELRRYLLENNIECGIHYLPNHLLSLYGAKKGLLPTTERLYSELLSLPLHPAVTPAEQKYIIDTIKDFFKVSGGKL